MAIKRDRAFERQLKKYLKVVNKHGTKGIRRVALAGLKGVMIKSPVDEGTFRANWNVGVNRIDKSTEGQVGATAKRDTKGKVTGKALDPEKFAEGNQRIGSISIGDSVNISNALPYANKLEYYNHSAQGSGMVRRTLSELTLKLKKENKKV